jgi:hypothetical protein
MKQNMLLKSGYHLRQRLQSWFLLSTFAIKVRHMGLDVG